MRRQALDKAFQLALKLLDVRILRRFIELLKVMHDVADDLGQFHPEDEERRRGGLRQRSRTRHICV